MTDATGMSGTALLEAEHAAHHRVLEVTAELRRAALSVDRRRCLQLGRELHDWTAQRDALHRLYERQLGVHRLRQAASNNGSNVR